MTDYNKTIMLVFYGVAMAMGVAALVLPFLGQPVPEVLYGIALFLLGLAGLNTIDNK